MSLLFPAAIEEHCAEILSVKMLDELLIENTYVPAFIPYLTEEERKNLLAHHRHTPYPNIAKITGMATFANFAGGHLRVCKSCVAEDKGVPVWRRASLLPGILHCSSHEERYVEFCGRCMHGFKHSSAARHLRKSCFCGAPLKMAVAPMSESAERASIRVSKFMQFCLDGGLINLNPGQIRAAYKTRARKCGIANALNITITHKFKKLMEDTGVGELAENLGLKTDSRGLLGRCIRGASFNANPVLNAFVQTFLFSEPGEFVAAAIDGEKGESDVSDELRKRVERVKGKISRACVEMPGISRRGLRSMGVHSREISLVIEYDHEWLEKKVPRRRLQGSTRTYSRVANTSHLDERAVRHIERAHEELISSPDLPRITQRRLLIGLPSASGFNGMRSKLPRAEALLKHLRETKEQHSLRRVRNWHPDVAQPELLSHKRRRRLIQKLRGERVDLH